MSVDKLDNLNHIADGRILATKAEIEAVIEKSYISKARVLEALNRTVDIDGSSGKWVNGWNDCLDDLCRVLELTDE